MPRFEMRLHNQSTGIGSIVIEATDEEDARSKVFDGDIDTSGVEWEPDQDDDGISILDVEQVEDDEPLTVSKQAIGECPKHGEYQKDAPDSPCPSCEDDEPVDVAIHNNPYEIETIALEALKDANFFDHIADTLDLSDDYLIELREALHKKLNPEGDRTATA
jgi:hypothetical protein